MAIIHIGNLEGKEVKDNPLVQGMHKVYSEQFQQITSFLRSLVNTIQQVKQEQRGELLYPIFKSYFAKELTLADQITLEIINSYLSKDRRINPNMSTEQLEQQQSFPKDTVADEQPLQLALSAAILKEDDSLPVSPQVVPKSKQSKRESSSSTGQITTLLGVPPVPKDPPPLPPTAGTQTSIPLPPTVKAPPLPKEAPPPPSPPPEV